MTRASPRSRYFLLAGLMASIRSRRDAAPASQARHVGARHGRVLGAPPAHYPEALSAMQYALFRACSRRRASRGPIAGATVAAVGGRRSTSRRWRWGSRALMLARSCRWACANCCSTPRISPVVKRPLTGSELLHAASRRDGVGVGALRSPRCCGARRPSRDAPTFDYLAALSTWFPRQIALWPQVVGILTVAVVGGLVRRRVVGGLGAHPNALSFVVRTFVGGANDERRRQRAFLRGAPSRPRRETRGSPGIDERVHRSFAAWLATNFRSC